MTGRWLLCFIFFLGGCGQAPPPENNLTPGQSLSSLALNTLAGESVSLDVYRGKLLVLNFWATWCEPCRREMPELQSLSDSLDPERFAVIGLSIDDDLHVVSEYLRDKGLTFADYIDPAAELATQALGIQIFPYTLLISPQGELIQKVPGARDWHSDEVVALLERAYLGDYSGF